MTTHEKRGAVLFFGKAGCVSCHRVDGNSNEMFSDFREHVLGVPQVFPQFGVNTGNFIFSGPPRTRTLAARAFRRSGRSPQVPHVAAA